MNNLIELQTELHKLSDSLRALEQRVGDMSRHSEAIEDYSRLLVAAERAPVLENTRLAQATETTRRTYFRLLSTVIELSGGASPGKLLHLCRLAMGCGFLNRDGTEDPEKLLLLGYQADKLNWNTLSEELSGLELPLLLDLLMISHMDGPTPERALWFITELGSILQWNSKDAEVTARLASALLACDEEAFDAVGAEKAYPELSYAVPEKWLLSRQVRCGEYQEQNDDSFYILHKSKKIGASQIVSKGEKLITYSANKDNAWVRILPHIDYPPIIAQADGVPVCVDFSNGNHFVYVVSPFDCGIIKKKRKRTEMCL